MKETSIVAVDLGGTKLRIGKIRDQVLTQRKSHAVPVTDRDEVVLQELIGGIQTVMDGDVAAIGIGVPSVVDVERGIVYAVQNIPSWQKVHLKERLESTFHVPVHVNNDANCFALGECHYGRARGFRHIVGLTIGTGLGAGIIIDRKLYNGSNCGAGEIGTIPYKDQTVEYYCSGQFFARECGMSGELVFERAAAGDANAIHVYEDFGREMAHAVMTALYAYDPEIVILGGSVSAAFRFFKRTMMEKLVATFAYQHALQRLVIEASELPDIALLGAAALHLDALERATS
ncbi:MAG TPA: ROK family protein [Acidobacteriota bacterium]|nr:ROK family protein [Acidobacteriota bacterium]